MSTPSDVPLERLHPLTLFVRAFTGIAAFAIALTGGAVGDYDLRTSVPVLGFALLYATVALPLLIAAYVRFRYCITEQEVVIVEGVFHRRKRNIPLNRIQNVEIERKLLPRMLGLAAVKIMTAGSGQAEGVLQYTSHAAALGIRNTVRKRTATGVIDQAFATIGDASGPVKGEHLFHMPLRRVVLAGAFRISFLYLALAATALTYAQQLTGVTEQDIVNWVGSDPMDAIAEVARRSAWILAACALALTLMLGWITGMIVTVARLFRFRLYSLHDKLVRSHGLLTLQEATIPRQRIQALVIRSNPLMRAFGWFRLELQTIGHDVSRRAGRLAVPLARRKELTAIGPHIRPFALPDTYERVSPVTIRRTFVRYTLALVMGVGSLTPFWSGAWYGLCLLPFLGSMAYLQYRNHGFALTEKMLYIRRGVIQQYIWIVPAERFQAFLLSGSLFQRRLGLSTVTADTAGAGFFRFPHIVDVPEKVGRALMGRLYAGLRASRQSDETPVPARTPHG